ncbi:unnamed protein product [Arctogadus glacialis]
MSTITFMTCGEKSPGVDRLQEPHSTLTSGPIRGETLSAAALCERRAAADLSRPGLQGPVRAVVNAGTGLWREHFTVHQKLKYGALCRILSLWLLHTPPPLKNSPTSTN